MAVKTVAGMTVAVRPQEGWRMGEGTQRAQEHQIRGKRSPRLEAGIRRREEARPAMEG